MKKKVIIVMIVVILLILLVPKPRYLNDGGTVMYKSLFYNITKLHKLSCYSPTGYDTGTSIEIFGIEVYNDIVISEPTIRIDFENCQTYSKTIDDINIELNIPNEWQYEEMPQNEEHDFYKYALKLYKNNKEQYAVLCFYNNIFGVCGTGRASEKIILNNGKEAIIGYYDKNRTWNDISFYEINKNIAVINNGLINDDAKEVIEFIKTINIVKNNEI